MTRYLFDTNVLIDYSKGVARVVSQVQAWVADGDEVGISAVQIAEFFSGVSTVEIRTWTSLLDAYDRGRRATSLRAEQASTVTTRHAGAFR